MNLNKPPRVRIAPSPTGDPHIGTAYIGLFNYVFAKKNGGKFILRIEDTDQNRYRGQSEAMIMDAIRWVGLQWDEGPDVGGPFGPYKQSERLDKYRRYADLLIKRGNAYPCFCSGERLDALRKRQTELKEKTGYDRHCRNLDAAEAASRRTAGEKCTIRFKMPVDGITEVNDGLRGKVVFDSVTQDDLVILKTDGFPTYHLASVVDDHLMEISHVIRGEEWLSSTAKHVRLYEAFGWDQPLFFHLPLLRNPDKSKISKRKNPTSINYYRRKGIVPEALRNYLGLMGFSIGGDREKFTTDEMIQNFDLMRISLGGPVFDVQKLVWLNGLYLRELPDVDWLDRLRNEVFPDRLLKQIVPLVKDRINSFEEFLNVAGFYFTGDLHYDRSNFPPKGVVPKDCARYLSEVLERFEQLDSWDAKVLHDVAMDYVKQNQLKTKDVLMSLRVAVSGTASSPPLFESMVALGKEMTRRRFRMAAEWCEKQET